MLQAQDRCHRIGQTREVHIYRLVSERTIEENILHKSDQKRRLDHLAIQSGGFNTEHILQKFNPRELLGLKGASQPHYHLCARSLCFICNSEMHAHLVERCLACLLGYEGHCKVLKSSERTCYHVCAASLRVEQIQTYDWAWAGAAVNGGGAAAAPGAGGMSEEEVAAALRSVEDEGDAAAAAALERETAAELAEFSAEPNAAPGGEVEADDEDADAGCAHAVDCCTS